MIVLISAQLFAQAPTGFYLKGGITQTTLNSNDLLSEPGIGYNGGINFNFGYHETFNYQIEMTYSSRVINVKAFPSTSSLQENELTKVAFTYPSIDFGFYFNYYILKPDQDKFFVGPQVGLNTSISSGTIATDNDTNSKYLPYLNYNFIKSGDATVRFDAGFGLTGGYNRLRFDLRYSLGLTNVLDDVELDSYTPNNLYNGPELFGKFNTISFGVSYFLFKSKPMR